MWRSSELDTSGLRQHLPGRDAPSFTPASRNGQPRSTVDASQMRKPEAEMELDGKTIVLTGATSGIGRAAARLFAAHAEVLVVHGPEHDSDVADLLNELRDSGRARVEYVCADFTRLDEVRHAADRIRAAAPPIDVLINNAGIPGPATRRLTDDGFERTLQVNFLALALLTELLIPALVNGGRIVNVGSTTHRMTSLDLDDLDLRNGYDPVRAYAQSKLAIITYSNWLSDRLPRRISTVSISPGVISTTLLHSMFGGGGAPVEHGGQRIAEAATAHVPSGSYIDDGDLVPASDDALDEHNQAALAEITIRRISRPH
jgi:NAD(P)-dependent dehydrogenase (short-subunit alcohol dehydrogenase family)